jgi:hypothetical protein
MMDERNVHFEERRAQHLIDALIEGRRSSISSFFPANATFTGPRLRVCDDARRRYFVDSHQPPAIFLNLRAIDSAAQLPQGASKISRSRELQAPPRILIQ